MTSFWMALVLACGSPATESVVSAPPAHGARAPELAAPPAAEAPAADGWSHFGAAFTVASAVPASTVLAAPGDHVGRPVRVTGQLNEVCQKKGCWAVISDDAGHRIRVTMKDHAFGIEKDGAGRACDIEGELVKKAVDPATIEHYKSEGSTKPPEEGQAEAYELVASAVSVKQQG